MKTGDYQPEEHKNLKKPTTRGMEKRITEEEIYNFLAKVVTERQMPATILRKRASAKLHF